jgi:hypothetical protein
VTDNDALVRSGKFQRWDTLHPPIGSWMTPGGGGELTHRIDTRTVCFCRLWIEEAGMGNRVFKPAPLFLGAYQF